MDTTQVVLILVVTALTILLVVIGIQVILILKELRRSMEKMNKMLDDAGLVTGSVTKAVSGAAGLVEGIKAGLSLVNFFHKEEPKKT